MNEDTSTDNKLTMGKVGNYFYLFIEQVFLLSMKSFSQKQRQGRQFWKDTVMIQFFLLSFTTYILYNSSTQPESADVYSKHSLPPLSDADPWGIFNENANGNTQDDFLSKKLFYTPNTHAGVNSLIDALVAKYPQIDAVGCSDTSCVIDKYQENLFDTWASLEFSLTNDQKQSGQLITSQTDPTTVSYTILVNPTSWQQSFGTSNYTSNVYNKQSSQADLFWISGYMTLQNFVDTYLVQQYNIAPPDFSVDTFIQRYPKSPIYEEEQEVDIRTALHFVWMWIGATILSMCLFVPMLGLLNEIVRERQYRMKDLLEISGLMNVSYWMSYYLVIFCICQFCMWICIGIMTMYLIFNETRITAYASLLTVYILGSTSFGMIFGFVIPRSEYYGLPAFVINSALTVGGAYLGIAYQIPIGVKLLLSFVSPSLGLTMGVLTIEDYLYFHDGSDMDYEYENLDKNYPNLNDINGVILFSAFFYLMLTIGMPFDWLLKTENVADKYLSARMEEVKYPCDNEEEELEKDGESKNTSAEEDEINKLLQVKSLSHIYPDGTHAVKDVTFSVKQGEVLSFLGANGAGKSTCMGMLCGTLQATFGDAKVNGFSISHDRTLARRNLGIAMQQDIIWDDVNVEDHLMLFGRLRGLHGKQLRDDVEKMAISLGFPDKRKSLAGTLSGGQKRRLCVGLSMVGGNSVVYLDEPTAGLDPVSRRQLWELVQKNREGRAILLTTHFMDEADVLGDRIAVVKEGRLRALGTSRFLKTRFGLGYLLRMSLNEGADTADQILARVQNFASDATQASRAGTELSIRLPREAVEKFPQLFEALEGESSSLSIQSYGIETTTLEEVFMRIVNEDNEHLLANHAEANRLLVATHEERDLHSESLKERDEKRNPLGMEQMNALLTKGSAASGGSSDFIRFYPQLLSMLYKRFFQFVRSRGQWAMGIAIPFTLAIMVGILLNTMPSDLLDDPTDPKSVSFFSAFPLLIAGSNQSTTEALTSMAFGNTATTYIGENYTTLFDYVEGIATAGFGTSSSEALVYDSLTNFTVMFNSSYTTNFPAAVQQMLTAAASNATNNLLRLDRSYNSLPESNLGAQLNNGFFIAMLVSLLAGSVGAGLSIVVSGERVTLVKHQQLASGASTAAYWSANFVFDFGLMFALIILFSTVLAALNATTYTGDGFSYVLAGGFFFSIAVIFRFYSVSYLIADVKLAQSIYFYGSLAVVFILIDIWFTVLFVTADGNIGDPTIVGMGYAFTILDPAFGFYCIVLYQNNFLGVLTQNGGAEFFSEDIAAPFLYMLILDAFLYAFIFIVITENAFGSMFSGSSHVKKSLSKITGGQSDNKLHPTKSSMRTSSVSPAPRLVGSLDSDVRDEQIKVHKIYESSAIDPEESAIFVHDLRKVYFARGSIPAKVAVKNINISIPRGEVFGLLGANGAGKTTLLKMVSGLEQPTEGSAYINGYDVVKETSMAQRSMGLCPQFDTLVERLSVRENLLFFGKIKGLSNEQLVGVAEAFMTAMNIKRYENKLIQQLSGGNRRKVSLAVALIGAPPTVYLDEPSTGLDPVASRLMWRLLSKISSLKTTAIVLTTHNMLECEAVCTRICIMKLGEMVCLGDNQHLRSVHGTGFLLEMHLTGVDKIDTAKQFVFTNFANTAVVDEHATMLNFEIPRDSIAKLSQAFKLLETNKTKLGIIDYALSQSTLEQVFLKQIRPNDNDARNQEDQKAYNERVPLTRDYVTGYFVWFLALFLPGFHHFYLGNFWRGVKYLLTFNEVLAGWILDLPDMHVLIQKSVQEKGNVPGFCFCSCCFSLWCGCCGKAEPLAPAGRDTPADTQMETVV